MLNTSYFYFLQLLRKRKTSTFSFNKALVRFFTQHSATGHDFLNLIAMRFAILFLGTLQSFRIITIIQCLAAGSLHIAQQLAKNLVISA